MGFMVPCYAILAIAWDCIGPAGPEFRGRVLDRQGVKQGVNRLVLPSRRPALETLCPA